MKQSKMYIPTQKDISKQAVAISHIYALKAGLVHQTAAGIYSYLPLAKMMINNIETIIREELEKIDGNEVILPTLEPAELWQESGRWDSYGSELMRMTDRRGSQFALGPTHEEIMTELVRNNLRSYKNYPANLYQITTKFRDEARPRFGLLRGREFFMMDAYTYSTDQACLEQQYNNYYQAYTKIFDRLGLEYKTVKGDNGQMGGSGSHEFMALADIGEDTIAYEENSEVAYNIEIAPVYYQPIDKPARTEELTKVHTPDCTSIDDLVQKHNFDITKIIKTFVFKDDQGIGLACVRGDREVNEVKIQNFFKSGEVYKASAQDLKDAGLVEGYVGPMNTDLRIVVDPEAFDIVDGIIGANEADYHMTGFNFSDDVERFDIRLFETGDRFSADGDEVFFKQGIEIGHIFALGDRYTKAMGMQFLDQDQKQKTPLMGCYGIGVSRLISAIIEQNHDDRGMILPKAVAPFDVHVIVLDYNKKEDQKAFADKLVSELEANNIKVLLDDRNDRPGSKFADADLLGLPIQIVVGRGFVDNKVEFKLRSGSEKEELDVDAAIKRVLSE